MRIAIDARKLHNYGIGTYVRNILSELARQDGGHTYVLLCRPADAATLRTQAPRFETLVDRAGHYSVREQISIPLALRLLARVPWLRRIPGRLVGMGVRPEHVRTPEIVSGNH